MPKAVWNGEVIAESDDTVIVEGNHYFPESSVRREAIAPSDEHSICPWKGTASYYDVVAGGQTNSGAAWYYPEPKPEAAMVADRVAFWRGVTIEP
jgi:uncharacterized protein (DUF427 family)